MRRFAIVLLSTAGIFGPYAANAMLKQNIPVTQNTPPVISVSGARDIPSNLSDQLALLNSEVSALQQQVRSILRRPTVTAQAPTPLYQESLGG
jgi:hypothetical protein